jgi:adenylate cyclase
VTGAASPSPRDEPIDAATLGRRTGLDAATIERLVALGIVRPRDDGSFRAGDITTARLAVAFESSGIRLDDVAAALERGALPDVGRILPSVPIGLTGRSHAEVARDLGIDEPFAREVLDALGLPDLGLDAPIREDDAELLAIAADAVRAGLPQETLVRTFRVFAEHLDRMAEHMRSLFRVDIQDRMLASGRERAEMLEASAVVRERLVALAFRGSQLIHRRLLERHATENTTEQLELLLDEAGVRRRVDHDPPAIAFVDMSGYTRLTQEEGDERAARWVAEFATAVRRIAARHDGRVVKLLGDGAMLRFDGAARAVAASAEIVASTATGGSSSVHAGIAAGPVIVRDGDYFGHTVNLAARICDAATAGAVLATRGVAERVPEAGWISLGAVALDGVPAPVELAELTPGR